MEWQKMLTRAKAYNDPESKEAYPKNSKGIAGAGARRALWHALFVYPHQGAPAYAVFCDHVEKDIFRPKDRRGLAAFPEHPISTSGQQ